MTQCHTTRNQNVEIMKPQVLTEYESVLFSVGLTTAIRMRVVQEVYLKLSSLRDEVETRMRLNLPDMWLFSHQFVAEATAKAICEPDELCMEMVLAHMKRLAESHMDISPVGVPNMVLDFISGTKEEAETAEKAFSREAKYMTMSFLIFAELFGTISERLRIYNLGLDKPLSLEYLKQNLFTTLKEVIADDNDVERAVFLHAFGTAERTVASMLQALKMLGVDLTSLEEQCLYADTMTHVTELFTNKLRKK